MGERYTSWGVGKEYSVSSDPSRNADVALDTSVMFAVDVIA